MLKKAISWFGANPLYGGAALALALVLVISGVGGYFAYKSHENKRHEGQLIELGKTTERSDANAETINAVDEGKRAVEQPTAVELNKLCQKYDRNCH